jgi:hypothetical protein
MIETFIGDRWKKKPKEPFQQTKKHLTSFSHFSIWHKAENLFYKHFMRGRNVFLAQYLQQPGKKLLLEREGQMDLVLVAPK